jgi:alpha-1,2-mannosyltransferase
VALGGLLVAPVSWTHHWLWVLPAIALMLRRRWWVMASLTFVAFYLPPMWALKERPDEQLGYTPFEVAISASWSLWAALVLVTFVFRVSPAPLRAGARQNPRRKHQPASSV